MSSEVEQFAQRLKITLAQEFVASRRAFLDLEVLQKAVDRALDPTIPTNQYPKWVFRNSESRIVASRQEEAAARSEGWGDVVPPRFEEGYPKFVIERPLDLGGTKRYDLRAVSLLNREQEAQFLAVVEINDWVEDPEHKYGARGIPLSVLVEERKELLKSLIDAEQLEVVAAPEEQAPELPCEVAPPEEPAPALNPDEAVGAVNAVEEAAPAQDSDNVVPAFSAPEE